MTLAESPEARDHRLVTELLGREPQGGFTVAVRDPEGAPVVIRNAPLLYDGTPMPTLYWLVGRQERVAVDRLEATGGVRRSETAVDPAELEKAHASYAAERDASIPEGYTGLRPRGGVGGARRGVKCLHAHYASYLAGHEDPIGRWVAAELRSGSPPVAAIDCGTNSTRLLVAGADGETIERLMRITRLGEAVDRTHVLAPGAIRRTVSALEDFRGVMDRHGASRVRMTATSAARDAANREEFFEAARAVIGVCPELLGGEEEGALSFAGATAELEEGTGPWLVVDIGGGSTELVAGVSAGARPSAVRSLEVGCVRITERFLHSDPPSAAERDAARRHVRDLLSPLPQEFASARTMVGLAGTVAALAAIDQGLTDYDRDRVHHHTLTRDRVGVLLDRLAAEPVEARRLIPGVEHDRADVIVGGTIVLATVMDELGFDRCLSSESDILDGLARTLLEG